MFPRLVDKLPFLDSPLHTFGVMVGLGFVCALLIGIAEGRKRGINRGDVIDLALWEIVMGVVGARLLYAAVQWEQYVANPALLFSGQGGQAYYGGLIAALGVGWVYCRMRGIAYIKAADLSCIGVTIGHAVGRIGCFGAGCCWGAPAPSWFPFGVTFTDPQAPAIAHAHMEGIALYPTQIMESLSLVGLYFFLTWRTRRDPRDGVATYWYFVGYGVVRFTMEIFRGDDVRGFLFNGWLSTSQMIGLVFIAVGLLAKPLLIRSLPTPARRPA